MSRTAEHQQKTLGCLDLWDKLELVFSDHDKQGRYRTRVEDFAHDYLVIDRPVLLSGDALFQVGADFTAYFIKPDSAYSFNGRILRKHRDSLEGYEITKPRQVDRNQRRRYYRIESTVPAKFMLPPTKGESETAAEPEVYEGTCLNISGCGLLLRTKRELEIGGRLLVTLRLPDTKDDLNLVGIIRRQEEDQLGGRRYGIEFFVGEEMQRLFEPSFVARLPEEFRAFNENRRTQLLKHIFAQQIALKKKGLV